MKRVFSILGVSFLVFAAVCTFYARDAYQKKLPFVQVVANETGTFYFELKLEGTIKKLDSNRDLPDFAKDYVYGVTVSIPADATYIELGDNVELLVSAPNQEQFYGQIISFVYEYSGDGKTSENIIVEIGFPNVLDAIDNKTVAIKMKKETTFMDCILPQETLFEDLAGQYIYLVKKRDGAWGSEYYLERMNIKILASTESKFSIDRNQSLKYPVVIHSNNPIQNGQIVRLYP